MTCQSRHHDAYIYLMPICLSFLQDNCNILNPLKFIHNYSCLLVLSLSWQTAVQVLLNGPAPTPEPWSMTYNASDYLAELAEVIAAFELLLSYQDIHSLRLMVNDLKKNPTKSYTREQQHCLWRHLINRQHAGRLAASHSPSYYYFFLLLIILYFVVCYWSFLWCVSAHCKDRPIVIN